ncbi:MULTISPECIES: hypothetical protein [unclassified Mesorhizobium]|uniref:hypothetical protein n=1 Tax=unclassified Mesorhizobium TaxID=325217 RepID=UPI000FDAA69D|nr:MULTISPECIES: hypothetical protein [unclassified Mesorhizobium]TGR39580.1 hypothetical protein EN842_40830 [bacterium M00.F.Ca.ET.199.01.1.1]TGU29017.1 hypothetical protein EN799_36005 [bacterium M00.F.Ca.ET.156.01.1.1]TGV84279.1 hypothetical protein EN792_021480 [Mesorhizobium sp. M00.F.Ca.ET.149.01.1.1]TGR22407.1 hypothetical protein EN845_22145 [Mesorhizobium sp. M8A.F.Ca.ET.202.01.1.1]TGR23888.1 hypothetical protein EN840_20790 [Mesorhizobium sp. M8A.F.Ca.ET.197.01.1.1]
MTSITTARLDGLSSSTAIKGPCKVATTANIILTHEQTIDGVSVVTGDRVLVKNQTTATDNGIYIADTGVWRRSADFAKTRDVRQGSLVLVAEGSANSGLWQVATADPISIGTTEISFSFGPAKFAGSLPSRSLIKMLVPQPGMSVILTEAGRTGPFIWTTGDFTALAALDTLEGVVIKANSVALTVGAWVRDYDIARPEMWGAVGAAASAPNSSVPDEYAALQCMLNVVGYTGGAIEITPGRAFKTNTRLYARITRQQAALKTLAADLYISDKSSFKLYSDGSGKLIAGAAMTGLITFQYNSAAVGGVTNSRGPDQSEVCGLVLDCNGLAVDAIISDYTFGVNIHDNTIFDYTRAACTWTGYGGSHVAHNVFKGPVGVGIYAMGGGDIYIGENQYFFPLTGGRAVFVQDSANVVVAGGTVNSESISGCIAVEIEATSGHSVRQVVVRDMEWSGLQVGVYAHTASASERIYGLVIDSNHATSGSGFDRPVINPGAICLLQRCDEVSLNNNMANSRNLSVASDGAYSLSECRDVVVKGAIIANYSGEAAYIQGCDNVQWVGGSVRDVGQAGAGGAIFDLDGSTNCNINPARVVQTSGSYAQIGIIERAGSSGNTSLSVDWVGVSTPWQKTGSTNGVFRRFKRPFAEVKFFKSGSTLTQFGASANIASLTSAGTGLVDVAFTTAHPDASSYRVTATGASCKVYVQTLTTTGFRVVMLDLADSPVDQGCMLEVVSML